MADQKKWFESDILRISDDLFPDIDPKLDKLLKLGWSNRVQLLAGTERASDTPRTPYARTEVKITFNNERDLRQCVRLLHWSDVRLRMREDQRLLWDWQPTFRQGMTIYFGVNWYNRDFFENRKDAFRNPEHESYYAMFGVSASDFQMQHDILEK